MSRHTLPRRTVLRGLLYGGAAVALPLPRLECMLNGNGTAYANGLPLRPRFVTWFFGNGIWPERWVPTGTGSGTSWQVSEQLAPLAEYKAWLSVVSGCEIKVPALYAHKSAPAAALTGAQANPQGDVRLPSIDQRIAGLVGDGTAFPGGLHVGISNVTGAGALDFNASFNGPNAPNPPEYSPAALFRRLVQLGGSAAQPDPALSRRRRVLDAVAQDARALSARLGTTDRRRLEQHLEGVAQLEGQLARALAPAACGSLRDPDKVYADRGADGEVTRARCKAFADLITFAFACELTRVASHVFTCAACHAPYREAGLGDATFHEDYGHLLSPQGTAFAQQGFNSGVVYTMSCLAELLQRLRDTPDGAESLLHNSGVYVTSCVSTPWVHSMSDYPLLVIGKAGGALRGDTHVRVPGANVSSLPLTLLRAYGGNDASFGMDEGATTQEIGGLRA